MNEIDDIGFDLEVQSIQSRDSGRGKWITGTIAGHWFEVLVFADHADIPSDEIGRSRISKFHLKMLGEQKVVANFDRGWDVEPATDAARQITDFLAEGIATVAFED